MTLKLLQKAMPTDKRVDTYIGRSEDFAKPVLNHLRKLIHRVIPSVKETIKWGFPHFESEGVVMSTASFKAHCAVVFPKASLFNDGDKVLEVKNRSAMGHLGKIRSLKDLPSDKVLSGLIRQAVALNKDKVKAPRPLRKKPAEIELPADFKKALKSNKKALEHYESFSPSHRREYINWIIEAKREETRKVRIEKSLALISGGRDLNYKYKKAGK